MVLDTIERGGSWRDNPDRPSSFRDSDRDRGRSYGGGEIERSSFGKDMRRDDRSFSRDDRGFGRDDRRRYDDRREDRDISRSDKNFDRVDNRKYPNVSSFGAELSI